MDIDTQFDKFTVGIREDCRGKSNGVLEHGFIKYLIDQIEFLREEVKAKMKSLIICLH